MHRSPTLVALVLLAAYGATGCRRSPDYGPLAAVSGVVTVDGEPLDNGTVAFVTPASGDVQVFQVRGGRFAGRARVGRRRVEFRRFAAPAERPATDLPGPVDPFPANTLPDHLGAMSTITATVACDAANTFTFTLRTDGGGE